MNEEMLTIFKSNFFYLLSSKLKNVSIRCFYPDNENALKVTIYAGDFHYTYYLDYVHEHIYHGMTAEWLTMQVLRDFAVRLKKFYFC